jgi:GrpB-like predicted nucleotidyltransferase (UPF0157 family)
MMALLNVLLIVLAAQMAVGASSAMPCGLVPHDPGWADIRGALGSTALGIEHVGSTAIPGIVAKPVIDVLVLVERYDPEAPYRAPLESLGYGFDHRDETQVFFEGSARGMRVQVHVVEASSEDSRMTITFRDYLRAHPEVARRYEDLKKALAEAHSDGNAYANAKSSYVWEIVRRATAPV